MNAWKIDCPDEDHGGLVVFADDRNAARWMDSRRCDCKFIEIRRAPHFDDLSPGPVTSQQYLDRGWYWTCGNCEKQRHKKHEPIVTGEYVFCNRECIVECRESWRLRTTEDAHESVVALCRELDEWLAANPKEEEQNG